MRKRKEGKQGAGERCAEAGEQLGHGSVVGDEQGFAVEGEGEVAIADFEGDADGVGVGAGRDGEDRLGSGFDDDVRIGTGEEDLAGLEAGAGGKGQSEFEAGLRAEAGAGPAALLGGEHERIGLLPGDV